MRRRETEALLDVDGISDEFGGIGRSLRVASRFAQPSPRVATPDGHARERASVTGTWCRLTRVTVLPGTFSPTWNSPPSLSSAAMTTNYSATTSSLPLASARPKCWTSQSLMESSRLPDASRVPSGENASASMLAACAK